ncbi:MAG: 50S ribosomal protein L21 [Solirubrobacterales bacterium]|nr:50S ribosomal protein L21 [Solirubrobacterales bacterium]
MSDSDAYAIVESGGKQYRAEQGTTLLVDRLPADEGTKVNLRAVMFRDHDDVLVAGGDLEKVKVEALVAAHERGRKLRVFKYRAKKGYRRRAGHRSELTRLEVTEVTKLSRKPAKAAAKKPAEAQSEAKQPAEKPAATKPAEKKPAVSKPAAKKPAATKPAAKKPAAKKSASKPKAAKPASDDKEG